MEVEVAVAVEVGAYTQVAGVMCEMVYVEHVYFDDFLGGKLSPSGLYLTKKWTQQMLLV